MTWNPVPCTLGPRVFILFYFFLSVLSILITRLISFYLTFLLRIVAALMTGTG